MDSELDAVAPLARRELARRHVADCLGELVPNYERAAHADLIADHLEALERRDIRRLICSMPPRHGKTLHVSQAFPAWYLGRRPAEHVILASYAAELAEANSRRARGFLRDPRYPFATTVAADSSAVNRWETTDGGGVIAAGVMGGITGFGADCLIVDDPVKGREEADSPTIREATWRWWTEVALTRLQPGAVVLLTSTRWHEDDLTGRVLNGPGADGWTVLNLPALAGDDDPLGRDAGDALWPAWFSAEHLAEMRRELGERAFQALYQQEPTPERGGIFRRAWLEGRYENCPADARIIQTVDSAFKTGTANDFSVVATWASAGPSYLLVDVWRDRVEFPDLIKAIESAASKHRPSAILIEDTAAGQSAIQQLRRTSRLPVIAAGAQGTKVSRAEAVSPLFESGRVLLPMHDPGWLGPWVEEHVKFPATKHDDQVDTTSMALARLSTMSESGAGVAGVIRHESPKEAVERRRAASAASAEVDDTTLAGHVQRLIDHGDALPWDRLTGTTADRLEELVADRADADPSLEWLVAAQVALRPANLPTGDDDPRFS